MIGRHAHADQYKSVNFAVPGAGRLTLTYTPDDGSPATSHEVTSFPAGGGVAMGMYNYTDSIRDFARACFSYGLRSRFPVYLSTKNTVLKAYDGQFKDVFDTIYADEFRDGFEAAGIGYEHRLTPPPPPPAGGGGDLRPTPSPPSTPGPGRWPTGRVGRQRRPGRVRRRAWSGPPRKRWSGGS